jgi:uncharacterized protein YcbX
MATIQSIYRYPIKGLSPEPLNHAALTIGQTVRGDRLYAIENGPSGFNPGKPYLPKTRFLMLMKNERLAALRTVFHQESHLLTVSLGGHEVVRGVLRSAAGRAGVERYFAGYCDDELRGPPKILSAEGHSFSDVARKVVSIINLGSVAAVEDMVGVPVDPRRFRANLYVEGWSAWSELDLVGRELTAGGARLKVVKRIVRCAATDVDPATGIRDLDIPHTLMRNLDHGDCGIYAEVISAGDIAAGDTIALRD